MIPLRFYDLAERESTFSWAKMSKWLNLVKPNMFFWVKMFGSVDGTRAPKRVVEHLGKAKLEEFGDHKGPWEISTFISPLQKEAF